LTRRNTFSRVAVALAVVTAVVTLAGCSATSSPKKSSTHLTVGSILLATGGYQTAHDDAMKAYAKTIGVTIKTCSSNGEVATQLTCVNDMISAHVDAVIIQPVDPKAATTMVKQLQAAHIATVTWAVGPVPGVKVPFIPLAEYSQAKAAGEKAAAWVKANFHESPLIVDLDLPNNTNCTNRETGFIAGAKEADPASKVVAEPNGQGNRLASATVMADVISSGKKFNIVTGCNGESTLGGLNALKAAGRGKAVDKKPVSEYLFSVDGTPDEITQLVDPSSPLMATLALDPYTNVRVLLNTAIKLHEGKISNSYTTNLKDIPLPTDCAQVNTIIKKAYGTTVACPAS
jgi:ABC-type sugar transport system substrate-binding protein